MLHVGIVPGSSVHDSRYYIIIGVKTSQPSQEWVRYLSCMCSQHKYFTFHNTYHTMLHFVAFTSLLALNLKLLEGRELTVISPN